MFKPASVRTEPASRAHGKTLAMCPATDIRDLISGPVVRAQASPRITRSLLASMLIVRDI